MALVLRLRFELTSLLTLSETYGPNTLADTIIPSVGRSDWASAKGRTANEVQYGSIDERNFGLCQRSLGASKKLRLNSATLNFIHLLT